MPPALTKQFVGLPRWAWIGIIAGGLAIGLIIRSRRNAVDSGGDVSAQQADIPTADTSTDPYGSYDYSGDPSLAGGYPSYATGASPYQQPDLSGVATTDDIAKLDEDITNGFSTWIETWNKTNPDPTEPVVPGGGGGNDNPKGCSPSNRPATKAGNQVRCVNNRWRQVPIHRQGGGHGGDGQGAGDSGSHGGQGGGGGQGSGEGAGGGGGGGNSHDERQAISTTAQAQTAALTGGGAPNRPAIHSIDATPSRVKTPIPTAVQVAAGGDNKTGPNKTPGRKKS